MYGCMFTFVCIRIRVSSYLWLKNHFWWLFDILYCFPYLSPNFKQVQPFFICLYAAATERLNSLNRMTYCKRCCVSWDGKVGTILILHGNIFKSSFFWSDVLGMLSSAEEWRAEADGSSTILCRKVSTHSVLRIADRKIANWSRFFFKPGDLIPNH